MLVVALLLISVYSAWAADSQTDQEIAVFEIEILGGNVTRDEDAPNKPVIGADLSRTKVTDDVLACLRHFPQLHTLNLARTKITDAGLAYVKELTELRTLGLEFTEVTDHGLGLLPKI